MIDNYNESWLPIAGYEGFYEVSSLGRVRSVGRLVDRRLKGVLVVKERVRMPVLDKKNEVSARLFG